MCDETESYNVWCAGEDAKNTFDVETLGAPKSNQQYLNNRLHRAFMAGYAAGARNTRLATMKKLNDLIYGGRL